MMSKWDTKSMKNFKNDVQVQKSLADHFFSPFEKQLLK
jgi:hypothetical protein